MTRHALTLAALLDAAVAGSRPARVEEVIERVGERYRVGFVEDTAGQRWVVRLPCDAVAAALQDQSVGLLHLLADRLPFAIPRPAGFASVRDGRRAMVYPLIPGRLLSFEGLPAGPGLADALAQAIAAIHNLDPAVYEEAGMPTYDAGDCRRRRQSDVDLGAQTGLVPAGLLHRWELMLDDVASWRFATRPVHGHLDAAHVLVCLPDPQDAATGTVAAITSWEYAQVGDPAEDVASLLAQAQDATAATVLRSYVQALRDPADAALRARATLLSELRYLSALLTAKRLDDALALRQATEALRRLDARVGNESILAHTPGSPIETVAAQVTAEATPDEVYRSGSANPAPAIKLTHYPSAAARANGDADPSTSARPPAR